MLRSSSKGRGRPVRAVTMLTSTVSVVSSWGRGRGGGASRCGCRLVRGAGMDTSRFFMRVSW